MSDHSEGFTATLSTGQTVKAPTQLVLARRIVEAERTPEAWAALSFPERLIEIQATFTRIKEESTP
ncbi:hypothetical protein AB4Y71_17540 [Glutamicibacter sp. MCAF14]